MKKLTMSTVKTCAGIRPALKRAIAMASAAAFLLTPAISFSADPAKTYHLEPEIEKEYHFSMGVRVGDVMHIGGIISVDEKGNELYADDARKQMELIYKRLERVLADNGLTFKNVVAESFYYSVDAQTYVNTLDIRAKYYEGVEFPVASGVQVAGFTSPNILIELRVIADLSK